MKKTLKVSKYGMCKCSTCGATAMSATIGSTHISCSSPRLPDNFDRSLRGRLVLRSELMIPVGTWEKFDPSKTAGVEDNASEDKQQVAA